MTTVTAPAAPTVTVTAPGVPQVAVTAPAVPTVTVGTGSSIGPEGPPGPTGPTGPPGPTGPAGLARRTVTKTGNYTAVSGDYVQVNATAGPVTITVPVTAGTLVGVTKTDATSNTVYVVGASGTVDGDPNAQIVSRWASADFIADGTNLSVVADYSTSSGGRGTATATTASLAAGAADSTTTCPLAKTYRLLSIQTSRPARVRLYNTTAHRTSDVARPVGTDPTSDAGVMFEFVTVDTAAHTLSPLVGGASMETTPTASIPMTVTNNDTVTGTVTVTLTWERVE